MPRVPPVTRAVIPVRDHLDFGLLLSSLAIFAISLSLLQLFELWKRFFGVKMLSTHTLSTDEFGKSGCSSSSDDEGECGPQKLTRAQRKRIRKKKVREAASRRRKLIGPVLPGDDDGSGDLSNESQGVVRNAAEKSDIGSAMPGTVSMSGLEVHILIWMHGIQFYGLVKSCAKLGNGLCLKA
ncbi:hypothetical protein RHGRI_029150 [Rhododendron griersonianum]|uniref:Uncharacterized protein n=1 Tax=Rhododendron griersonianum TaxID=479676 RepID=A0AAV6IJ27_9ERIC|nr:hypothetical protein RHGRI_029150 [Rhododendron griersonianum]KAG5528381.1 hypothetical protein RHGRI_029150 [Rhododendron griersonianum]